MTPGRHIERFEIGSAKSAGRHLDRRYRDHLIDSSIRRKPCDAMAFPARTPQVAFAVDRRAVGLQSQALGPSLLEQQVQWHDDDDEDGRHDEATRAPAAAVDQALELLIAALR